MFQDFLEYEKGTTKIVDVFKPPPGSTTFAEITFTGSKCAIAGTFAVTCFSSKSKSGTKEAIGGAIAKVSPENTYAIVGKTLFEASSPTTQKLKEYEEPSGTVSTERSIWNSMPRKQRLTTPTKSNSLTGAGWGAF